MYFVHSFASACSCGLWRFPNMAIRLPVVGRGLCLGVQFHPESQRLGRRLLANFLRIPLC